jgi:hypothetical protein
MRYTNMHYTPPLDLSQLRERIRFCKIELSKIEPIKNHIDRGSTPPIIPHLDACINTINNIITHGEETIDLRQSKYVLNALGQAIKEHRESNIGSATGQLILIHELVMWDTWYYLINYC